MLSENWVQEVIDLANKKFDEGIILVWPTKEELEEMLNDENTESRGSYVMV